MNYIRLLCLITLFFTSCSQKEQQGEYTLIKGGILLDLSEGGKKSVDISNAFILICEGKIEKTGSLSELAELAPNTRLIDASGKYLLPGLFDGFAAINNQSYANAYLYMGVTSIIAVDGARRGPFFGEGNPSPNIYRLDGVGQEKREDKELLAKIGSLSQAGFRVLLLMYGLTPRQIELALAKAHELGMATIGELGYTTYQQGIGLGIDAFVHTTRYSLDVAPGNMARAVADAPFSNDLESPKWKYYKFLTTGESDYEPLRRHAANLGAGTTYLMPTSSLSYLDRPGHANPWKERVAAILNIEDINRPADPATGNHSIDSLEQAAYSNLIANELAVLEPAYQRAGARYLAGSGTDVWGTMPGISLHHELQSLTLIGLSRREAIAAATTNFAEAFGWKNGKIAPGYPANLLILNKNPLEDLENLKDIYLLLLNGKEIDRQALMNDE